MTLRQWLSNIFNQFVITPTPNPTPINPPDTMIMHLLAAHNEERLKVNLPPLILSTTLNNSANIITTLMSEYRSCSHNLGGTTLQSRLAQVKYNYRFAGENIAYNYPDIPSLMSGWMSSPGHRANILSAQYTEIGIAVTSDQYWATNFGMPSAFKAEAGRTISLSGPIINQ